MAANSPRNHLSALAGAIADNGDDYRAAFEAFEKARRGPSERLAPIAVAVDDGDLETADAAADDALPQRGTGVA